MKIIGTLITWILAFYVGALFFAFVGIGVAILFFWLIIKK